MEKYLMHYKIKYNLKIRKVRFEKKRYDYQIYYILTNIFLKYIRIYTLNNDRGAKNLLMLNRSFINFSYRTSW